MVVVLPTPLTPMNRATDGAVSSFRAGSHLEHVGEHLAQARPRPSISLIFSAFTRRRNLHGLHGGLHPHVARISVSSSSS